MKRSLFLIVVLFASACSSGSLCFDDLSENAGHEACREGRGESSFCGPEGECIDKTGMCKALDCCLPGKEGDKQCQDTYDNCSVCVAGESDGRCSPTTCE